MKPCSFKREMFKVCNAKTQAQSKNEQMHSGANNHVMLVSKFMDNTKV